MHFFTDWTGTKHAFGMCVALAVQAAACDVETATDADDAVATGEIESEVMLGPDEVAVDTPPAMIEVDSREVTCNGGWPGTRSCYWTFYSDTDIFPNSIKTKIVGHDGQVKSAAEQVGARQINFVAIVHEGDVFNPGKNTTSYSVQWVRY